MTSRDRRCWQQQRKANEPTRIQKSKWNLMIVKGVALPEMCYSWTCSKCKITFLILFQSALIYEYFTIRRTSHSMKKSNYGFVVCKYIKVKLAPLLCERIETCLLRSWTRVSVFSRGNNTCQNKTKCLGKPSKVISQLQLSVAASWKETWWVQGPWKKRCRQRDIWWRAEPERP